MIDEDTRSAIDREIHNKKLEGQMGTNKVPFHTHNGTDSPVTVQQLVAGTATAVNSQGVGVVTVSNVGVTSLVAGTSIVLTPSTGTGTVTVSTNLVAAPLSLNKIDEVKNTQGTWTIISDALPAREYLKLVFMSDGPLTNETFKVTFNGDNLSTGTQYALVEQHIDSSTAGAYAVRSGGQLASIPVTLGDSGGHDVFFTLEIANYPLIAKTGILLASASRTGADYPNNVSGSGVWQNTGTQISLVRVQSSVSTMGTNTLLQIYASPT